MKLVIIKEINHKAFTITVLFKIKSFRLISYSIKSGLGVGCTKIGAYILLFKIGLFLSWDGR